MKHVLTIVFATALVMMTILPRATADTKAFDAAMQPVLEQYLSIQEALSGDTTKGVSDAAKKIITLSAKIDPATVTGEHAQHYRDIPKKLKAAATDMTKQKTLKDMRRVFKELSKPMGMWATMSAPKGINVVYCSMYKGSWLQKGKLVANPYYGKNMLRCGEIVSGQDAGHASGHMKKKEPQKESKKKK